MSKDLKTIIKKILKSAGLDIVYYFFRARIYVNKTAIRVEKNLDELTPLHESFDQAGVKLVEITYDSLREKGKKADALIFPMEEKSGKRYVRAIDYLNKGYRGLAVVRDSEVCGDIWYVSGRDKGPTHPDLQWLGIQCGKNEAYAFDMHLYRGQRGKNMATTLQYGALHDMKKKGLSRVIGYYWAENIPALWVHRTLRFKEVTRIKATRFFFIRRYVYEAIGGP